MAITSDFEYLAVRLKEAAPSCLAHSGAKAIGETLRFVAHSEAIISAQDSSSVLPYYDRRAFARAIACCPIPPKAGYLRDAFNQNDSVTVIAGHLVTSSVWLRCPIQFGWIVISCLWNPRAQYHP
jgi:hypothetical protein